MEETIINFSDSKMQKQKCHQHKGPISIKNVDIDKVIVPNKVPFGKKGFKVLLVRKMIKRLNYHTYFSQK